MAKFDARKLPKGERVKLIGEFYDAMSCMKSRDETRIFLRDLLTFDEMVMFVRRIEVALLLLAGYSYRDIQKALNVGADKVINVQKSLQKGGNGYRIIIQRLRKVLRKREKKQEKRKREAMSRAPDLTYLKKRYPSHFLLFNLIDQLGDWFEDDGKLQIEKRIESQKKKEVL